METSVLMGIISAVLIAVVNVLAYQLGKSKVEKKYTDEIVESISRANNARDTLRNNSDAVNELHEQFKR